MQDDGKDQRQEVTARDLVWASCVVLVAGCCYGLAQQGRFTGDGAGLATMFTTGGKYYNVLYLPLARALDAVGSFERFGALRWLSSGCAAVGLGGTFLVARAFGARRDGALVATLLLGASPALVFFATTVEIHAVHFAAVALVACVTLFAPWQRPALALALTALVFPLLYWTQQTAVLLGPGWLLLVQVARTRVAAPFRWTTLVFVVGPVLLTALFGALGVAALQRGVSLLDVIRLPLEQVETQLEMPLAGSAWWNEWIRPLGVLVPAGLAACCVLRARSFEKLAIGALLLPGIAFFSWWGVCEDGGYFLSTDPFLVALVGLGWNRFGGSKGASLLAIPLLFLQGSLSYQKVHAYDSRYDVEERMRLLGETIEEEEGSVLFVALSDYAPSARLWMPELDELLLWSNLSNQVRIQGRLLEPREVLDAFVLPYLAHAFNEHERVLVELAYRNQRGRPTDPLLRDLMAGVMAGVRERYRVEERPHPDWGLAIVRPHSDDPASR